MLIIELLKAALLGIVQGITEWLPISSTGHMILVNEFVHLSVSEDFWNLFKVIIQFGSILAVVVLYFDRLNPFSPKKTAAKKQETWSLWVKVLIATIPAGVVGILFDDFIDEKLGNYVVISLALLIYGILFIVIENRQKNQIARIDSVKALTYRQAALIGCCQMLALIPGTSRSGATIVGALLLGCSRVFASEFSFFMAIPVMAGASGIKILKYFMECGFGFTGAQWAIMLTGMLVAFVVSMICIKQLLAFVRKHDFKVFGYYRIVLAILVLLYFGVIA